MTSEPLSPAAAPTRTPLFFQRRFLPMWTALVLGAFTDNMLKQALSVALLYSVLQAPIIGNDDALPIIGAIFPISMLLFSTIAGQIADKNETSLMFRRTKLIEFILMLVAAAGFLTGNSSILILTLFLMGAQSAFYSPARTGAMPKYLHTNELVRGNAICSGGLLVAVMIGIVIGGLFITRENGPLLVSAILGLAALGGWLASLATPAAAANAPSLKIRWNAFSQGKELIGFALRARGVTRPVLGVAWYWTVGALVTVTIQFFTRDTLYGDETVVTVLMSLFAIGAAFGAVGASLLSKGRSGLGLSAVGAGVSGVMIFSAFLVSLGFSAPADSALQSAGAVFSQPRAQLFAGLLLVGSIATNVYMVPLLAAVQRRAPTEKRSRILAANNMMNALGAMTGFLLSYIITRTPLSAADVFLYLGLAQGLLAAYMIRRKYRVADGLYDEMLRASPPRP